MLDVNRSFVFYPQGMLCFAIELVLTVSDTRPSVREQRKLELANILNAVFSRNSLLHYYQVCFILYC